MSVSSFFPAGAFSRLPEVDDFAATTIETVLIAMEEGSLFQTDVAAETIYRFLWYPSFFPPILVRAETNAEEFSVTLKKTSGSDMNPGRLILNTVKPLSSRAWKGLESKMRQASFWELPTWIDRQGLDGVTCLIEARLPKGYHLVERWSPEKGAFRTLCLHFWWIAGMRVRSLVSRLLP